MREPSAHTLDTIWGHDVLKCLLVRLVEEQRLPHALLLHGPDGVGKRSLAFALAKLIFSQDVAGDLVAGAPAPAEMRWRFGQELLSDSDLFGGMDDLFGELGGEEKEAPPEEEKPKEEAPAEEPRGAKKKAARKGRKAAKKAKKKIEQKAEEAPPEEKQEAAPQPPVELPEKTPLRERAARAAKPKRRTLRPVDPRVDRLVSRSYPVEYDRDDVPLPCGFIDLTVVEPLGRSKSIKVEQARFLQDVGTVPPVESRTRVVIILGADAITASGANSLLKLIEEPPSFLQLILVTEHYHRVLETIRSRCVGLFCQPLEREELTGRLIEEEQVEEDLARVAASLAEGRPGRALQVLEGDLLRRRREVFEARLAVERVGLAALPLAVHRALASSDGVGAAAVLLMALARDRMVRELAPGEDGLLVNADLIALLESEGVDVEALHAEAERLLECLDLEDHPVVPAPQPALELAIWPN